MTVIDLPYGYGTTWTPPADCTSLDSIECVGGGGQGGGSDSFTLAGGGGGGGDSKKNGPYPVTPGVPINIQIGAPGTTGSGNVAGQAGTDTWFNSSGTVLAKGGQGGAPAASFANGAGGAGGAAASGVGDTKTSGTAGGTGTPNGGAGGTPLGGAGGTTGDPGTNGVAPGGGGAAANVTLRTGRPGAGGMIRLTYTPTVLQNAGFLGLI